MIEARNSSQFVLGVKRWTRSTKERLVEIPKEINWRISAKIVFRSPVDTGLFRGNWQAGINRKPRGILPTPDPTGTNTLGAITGVIMKMKPGDRFVLTNNLPYALALEYGHSSQAPQGMVRLTLQEFQQITRAAVAEVKRKIP